MISGHVTTEGTKNFVKKNSTIPASNYREFEGLQLSNVGIGTYLGSSDSQTDELVKNSVKKSISHGINVIDTAINYRAQRAERSVGKAISELIDEGKLNRDEIFVSTKNGYVTNDGEIKEDFWQYVNREYVQSGVIKSNDISSGYHCMSVAYLEDQFNRSLRNLGFDCIDLMYMHNSVEGQIQDMPKEEYLKNLKAVFELYEQKRKDEKLVFYGMATWECFRVPKDNPQYLSLSEALNLAKQAGGENNGFRFIQLPFNMYLDQALLQKNQDYDGSTGSILDAASFHKIGVFTSVPLMQGKLLAPGVMPEFNNLIPPLRSLQFIRSSPGVLAPLVGQKSEDHVTENLEIMKLDSIPKPEFDLLIKKLTSG